MEPNEDVEVFACDVAAAAAFSFCLCFFELKNDMMPSPRELWDARACPLPVSELVSTENESRLSARA